MEKRVVKSSFEIRQDGEGTPAKIGGVAAVVNSPTVLYEETRGGCLYRMVEVIKPGAFDDVMDDDVRALVNHNPEKILGRTTAGTLRLAIDKDGNLAYEVDPPETSYAEDLQVSIKRGDITQSSFGFDVKEDVREVKETDTEYIITRTINKFGCLYDVSPVTYPAYEDTVTAIRSKFQSEFPEKRKEENKGTPNLDRVNQKLRIRK